MSISKPIRRLCRRPCSGLHLSLSLSLSARQIFVKMGVTLLGCTVLSALFALLVLPALLLALAPNDARETQKPQSGGGGGRPAEEEVVATAGGYDGPLGQNRAPSLDAEPSEVPRVITPAPCNGALSILPERSLQM